MPHPNLWAAVLGQLLIHEETGCRHSALHAARLLDHLCEQEIDPQIRQLCERASQRLDHSGKPHACAA
ncbi:hypothetical protein [Azonexus sp.]|uniref:hypothetical protein n=1 Tax=Azonexus sp. TaxID=1872668 RepID=UPI0039E2B65A